MCISTKTPVKVENNRKYSASRNNTCKSTNPMYHTNQQKHLAALATLLNHNTHISVTNYLTMNLYSNSQHP
eukprot:gene2659-1657_t